MSAGLPSATARPFHSIALGAHQSPECAMLFWLRTRLAQPRLGTSAILRLAITSVVLGFAAITDAHALSVGQMTTNGRINPLGIGGDALSLAWSIESDTRGTVQGAYRVRVGTTEGADDVWDSGRVASDRQTDIALPASRPLRPATRYYWQAKIWDGNGTESAWSAPAWFEIGLPAAEWAEAKWIAHPQPAPASNGQSVTASALPLLWGKESRGYGRGVFGWAVFAFLD